jgi:hypothetical protein
MKRISEFAHDLKVFLLAFLTLALSFLSTMEEIIKEEAPPLANGMLTTLRHYCIKQGVLLQIAAINTVWFLRRMLTLVCMFLIGFVDGLSESGRERMRQV